VRCVDLHRLFPVPLTTCGILNANGDLAVGDREGALRILTSALTAVVDYCRGSHYRRPKKKHGSSKHHHHHHPTHHLLVRKLHWHAHSVAGLTCGNSSDLLYTGGDESVLVTWQLARGGLHKPAHVLPRLALGGIRHLLYCSSSSSNSNNDDAVLVYCRDNSLQLLDAVHKSVVWKVQGLAAAGTVPLPRHVPRMMAAASQSTTTTVGDTVVLLAGLAGAPGYLHWYSAQQQRVVRQLEVAPFNRVSRTERGSSPMPAPTIAHVACSRNVLLTVDVVPTENAALGAPLPSGAGSITTLRFWKLPQQQLEGSSIHHPANNYQMVAAMAHPHGSRNRVSALAVSDHGRYAVTVSNDERAFRLWRRGTGGDEEVEDGATVAARRASSLDAVEEEEEWMCRCKVSIPSGYSNLDSTNGGVAFSPDASVLAVAFGHHVTLWDHSEVALLTAIRHGSDEAPVESVQFLSSDNLVDLLLTQSATCVSLQSPYGSAGPAGIGWNWVVPESLSAKKEMRISQVEFLPSDELVAIAVFHEIKDKSRVVLVDALSGSVCHTLRGDASPVVDNIVGEVVALSALDHRRGNRQRESNRWITANTEKSSVVTLCALTSHGEMVCFSNREEKKSPASSKRVSIMEAATPAVPTLPLLAAANDGDQSSRKRKMEVLDVSDLEGVAPPTRGFWLQHFGSVGDAVAAEEGGPAIVPTSELPLLRGAFSRAFVGRHLHRRNGE